MKKRKAALSVLLLANSYAYASNITSPFDNVAVVTNTISWPYDATTYGTDSFQLGGRDNADTIILNQVKRHGLEFPQDFSFGVACAAYQYEGNRVAPSARHPDGIGWSLWDEFSKAGSWLNPNGTNVAQIPPTSQYTKPSGEVAIDGFDPKNYKTDIQYAKALGATTYRLSISWPRIFPHKNMTEPDEVGIKYYTDVLEEITKAGLTPIITLYHWDLPAWLYNFGDEHVKEEDKTYGWLDMSDAKDNVTLKEFQKYVKVSYQRFGKYTSNFSTFNEPLTFTNSAFVDNVHAPARYGFALLQKKNPGLYGSNLDESLERIPYLQAVNIIKAHDIAYKTIHALYEKEPSAYHQQPMVSIVLNSDWAEPYRIECSDNKQCHYNEKDIKAAKNNMDYMLGWWLNPVMFGSWPKSMDIVYKKRINPYLGNFGDGSCLLDDGTPVECSAENRLKLTDDIRAGGTLDALSINHYTGYFVVDMKYAKKHVGLNPLKDKVPPNQYGSDPNNMSAGWNRDQNAYTTQFRYRKFGDQGSSPSDDKNKRAYVIGNAGVKPWLRQTWFVYRKLLQYINLNYVHSKEGPHQTKSGIPFSDLAIYLTENGTSIFQESQKESLYDTNRIQYLVGNLGAVHQAIKDDDINVKLYTYWSIADNFEWSEGYDSRFGLLWVHYAPNANGRTLVREPKQSYQCYRSIIANRSAHWLSKECPLK